jgi:hypothetical protein
MNSRTLENNEMLILKDNRQEYFKKNMSIQQVSFPLLLQWLQYKGLYITLGIRPPGVPHI